MRRYDYIQEIKKFNPYHGKDGRFASSSNYTSFTYAPGKSKAHDMAIAREKERGQTQGPREGKDISAEFRFTPGIGSPAIQQVAEKQGFTGKPKLVEHAEFVANAKEVGVVGFRTWNDGADVKTREQKTATQYKDAFCNDSTVRLYGNGAAVWGHGIYFTTTSKPKAGKMPTDNRISTARDDSLAYGEKGKRATAIVTFDKSAKIGDGYVVQKDFYKMPHSERDKFGGDISAYAAAKGYDALNWGGAGIKCDYTVVFNRTKLVVLNDPDNIAFGLYQSNGNSTPF